MSSNSVGYQAAYCFGHWANVIVVCGAKSCLPGFYVRCGKDWEAHCS